MSDNDWPRTAPTLGQFLMPGFAAVAGVAAATILFGYLYAQHSLPVLLAPALEWLYGLLSPRFSVYLGLGAPMLACTVALYLTFKYINGLSVRLFARFIFNETSGHKLSTMDLLATLGGMALLAILYGYALVNIAAWVYFVFEANDKNFSLMVWMIPLVAIVITQMIATLIPSKATIKIRYLWFALHTIVVLAISVYFLAFCRALLVEFTSEAAITRWALFLVAAGFEAFVLYSWYRLLRFIRAFR